MGLAALPLGLRPLGQLGRDSGGCLLGRLQRGHRSIGLGSLAVPPDSRLGRPARGLVPAGVGREDQRVGKLLAGGQSGRLLLGLGREPPGLRPELGEDVLDPGEVGLGLGELVLGLAPAPLVSSDAGDLLEQGPALLWSERERLVDHALADEQERVVREVGRVEQVDEIAKADALLVEQVVVLARSVEPAAELEDAVVDGQEPVGVVEDEGHVGHAERRSLVGTGEDHVLRLAAAKRPALLPERPAEGVGEVALAGAVGSDDRADPATELDDRPLGERLEALQPKGKEAGRRGHREASAR